MGQMIRILRSVALALSCVSLAACGGGGADQGYGAPARPNQAQQFSQQAYRLGGGDQLRVIVFGEEDLSGEFMVDGEGFVSMPLVGQVSAGGRTVREFEQAVAYALLQGYLLDPRVSAEVTNYRPFYIIGEVATGGEYPFSQGMTVLNAVAVAGGYSYRADRRRVFITRADGAAELEFNLGQGVIVLPGDIIRIPERFF